MATMSTSLNPTYTVFRYGFIYSGARPICLV